MKYIPQFLYILLFSFVGELLQKIIPLPIPAAIYGLILLFLALATNMLKEEKIADCAQFLISVMPVLFVAPAVKILQYWDLISPNIVSICLITVFSTFITFAVSGLVTRWIQRKRRDNDHE